MVVRARIPQPMHSKKIHQEKGVTEVAWRDSRCSDCLVIDTAVRSAMILLFFANSFQQVHSSNRGIVVRTDYKEATPVRTSLSLSRGYAIIGWTLKQSTLVNGSVGAGIHSQRGSTSQGNDQQTMASHAPSRQQSTLRPSFASLFVWNRSWERL